MTGSAALVPASETLAEEMLVARRPRKLRMVAAATRCRAARSIAEPGLSARLRELAYVYLHHLVQAQRANPRQARDSGTVGVF